MNSLGPASTWVLRRLFFGLADRGFETRFGVGARRELLGRARALYRAHREEAPDAAGRFHLAVSCWVLAVHQALLERGVSPEDSVALLKEWLTGAYAKLLAPPLRVILAVVRRPYAGVARILRITLIDRLVFGKGFVFSRAAGEKSSELVVHRCLYHRFFTERGFPELTQVICHSDHAWIDVLDPARQGMRFERPSTLGYGGGQCVFRFVKQDQMKSAPRD